MSERSVSSLKRQGTGAGRSASGLALVGTYPPTRCGIASFTASLRRALLEAGADRVDVARVLDGAGAGDSPPEVVVGFRPDRPGSVREAAAVLSGYETVVIQHEFGIYGPASGRAVLDLADSCPGHVVVTFHTVTDDPTEQERVIVASLAARSRFVVALSEAAGRLLVSGYGIEPSKVRVIPHGTPVPEEAADEAPAGLPVDAGPLLLTWGLIGPGKGLDWAVGALPLVREELPEVHWVIAGQTHPKVLSQAGEGYRHALEASVRRLGLSSNVTLVDAYLPRGQIQRLVREATAVVLPYDSTQQTSSGVLMEAAAAGVPIVATAFPQAVEVAERGGALVVPHRDVEALARALVHISSDRVAASRMATAQRSMAAGADWRQVGAAYLALAGTSITAAAS